jgi:TonB family protein
MRFKTFSASLAVFLGLIVATTSVHVAKGQDAAASATARKVRTKVAPAYPALARQMNVTGKVKLEVTIAADGHVVNSRTVGGSPLLVGPATEAVKKWRYEPAPKETTEIVEFNFSTGD